MDRKKFIQSLLGTSALAAMPYSSFASESNDILEMLKGLEKPISGSMYGFSTAPIPKLKVGIIGLGNRGSGLIEMFQYMVEKGQCEIVALCDIREKQVMKAVEKLTTFQSITPVTYTGKDDAWKDLVKQDNVDLVLVTTPWRMHTPMALYSMENDKHVACEVPIAYTMEDCWSLVQTAERTKKHCIMIENCCYNEEELFVLNMIENGVFGDITHTEGAYLHDLRAHMLSEEYYEGQWRLKQHVTRDGNFYTTHGLGPIANYLKIGRGDNFAHLSSMSSRELNLSETAKRLNASEQEFKCGDMNNTMIRTEKGKTILLQFDVHTGRPYSRINKVVGTKAVHDGYPSRLFIDTEEPVFWGHNWLEKEEYNTYKAKYQHPLIKKMKSVSEQFKQGHGGMDFVMMYRLVRCLNLGLPLDLNVYDGVMWSAITPLSELSTASKSLSIPIPDFTGGKWKEERELEIMRVIDSN